MAVTEIYVFPNLSLLIISIVKGVIVVMSYTLNSWNCLGAPARLPLIVHGIWTPSQRGAKYISVRDRKKSEGGR